MNKTMLTIVLSLLILISCEPGSVGIFFSLERVIEIKEESRGLNPQSSIKSFVALGKHYYLTTTTLHVRGWNTYNATDDKDKGYSWTPVSHPDTYSVALKVGEAGGKLFVHFAQTGGGAKLFQSSEIDYSDAGNAVWTEVSLNFLNDRERLSNFFTLKNDFEDTSNDIVIIETREARDSAFVYRLYYVDISADSPHPHKIIDNHPLPFLDAEFDGTSYWFITTNELFSIVAADINTRTLEPVDTFSAPFIDSGDQLTPVAADQKRFAFSGLGYAPEGEKTYLVTEKSYIFQHMYDTNGVGAWSVLTAGGNSSVRFKDSGGTQTLFTDVLAVPPTYYCGDDEKKDEKKEEIIFVSSQNEGYISIDSKGKVIYPDPASELNTNFFSTDLYNGFISGFYYPPGDNVIFVLTPRNSLWRVQYNEGYMIWSMESQ